MGTDAKLHPIWWVLPEHQNEIKSPAWFCKGKNRGHLGSSALAKAQLPLDYPCVALLHAPTAGNLKLSSQKATSGLMGPQLPKSGVLFQLQKLVMTWPLEMSSCSHIVLLFSWWVCRCSAWLCSFNWRFTERGEKKCLVAELLCFHGVPSGNSWCLDNLWFLNFEDLN